jgi:hypothetical protein
MLMLSQCPDLIFALGNIQDHGRIQDHGLVHGPDRGQIQGYGPVQGPGVGLSPDSKR